MRYYGTLTGVISNLSKQKVYREGEEPEYWDSYFTELINVRDELGNTYGRVMIKASQKTALRLRNYIISNNQISFDCKEISDGVIIGIRNVCVSLIGLGNYPFQVITIPECINRFGHNLCCSECKYRNKKSDCLKYCINK